MDFIVLPPLLSFGKSDCSSGGKMKKMTVALWTLFAFFFGAFIGFLIAPVKHGVYIGNNSGNTLAPADGKKLDEGLRTLSACGKSSRKM